MNRRWTRTLAVPLTAWSLCIGAVGAQAELYRFKPMFLSEVSLALGIKPKLDESNTLTFGTHEAAQRFPSAARIGFDTGGAPLVFPNEVVAVVAVKPPRGALRDTLLVPLEHLGSGSYRLSQEPEAQRGFASWIAAHGDQMASGEVVLERVDGLYRQLLELNPKATTVGLSMHLSVAGQRLDSGLEATYERLPREFMDSFPPEFWADVKESGHPALRRELLLRDAERSNTGQ